MDGGLWWKGKGPEKINGRQCRPKKSPWSGWEFNPKIEQVQMYVYKDYGPSAYLGLKPYDLYFNSGDYCHFPSFGKG